MRDLLEAWKENGLSLEPNARELASHYNAGPTFLGSTFEEKVTNILDLIDNHKGYKSHVRTALMKEAETTSDFPALFNYILDRQLLQMYQIQKLDWRQYIKVGSQRDFRTANIIGVYGLQSTLNAVKERGEYQNRELGDGKIPNVLTKYGAQFGLSWEDIINDDLGAFTDTAMRLANAAARTEMLLATKLLAQSSGPNTSLFGTALTHPIDGATIDNKDTQVLSADNLFATINAMQNQLDSDGYPIVVDGFHVVVPPKKQKAALEAVSPAALIATGVGNAAARQTSANVVAQLNITIHVNSFLPLVDTTHGDTTWYVIADVSNGTAAQMNFLAGHEAPEVVMKAPNKSSVQGGMGSPMDGDFESDTLRWRVRHVLGGTPVDPRMAYAQAATS